VNHKNAVTIMLYKNKRTAYCYSAVAGYRMLQAYNFGIQGNLKKQKI